MHRTDRTLRWTAVIAAEVAGLVVAFYAGFIGLLGVTPTGFWGSPNSTADRWAGAGFLLVAAVALVAGPLVAAALRRSAALAAGSAGVAVLVWLVVVGFASSTG
jgi:hypothetical protein